MSYTRADRLFSKLCEEIDFLEDQLAAAEAEAEKYKKLYNDLLDKSLHESQVISMQVLRLALHTAKTGDQAPLEAFAGEAGIITKSEQLSSGHLPTT